MKSSEAQALMNAYLSPKSKYRNIRTEVDGIKFASKREAKRYGELRLLQQLGTIRDLQLQQRFILMVNGKKVCTYVSDFSYLSPAGFLTVEDVKSPPTRTNPLYRLKKKLMTACLGIEILEI